MNQLIKTLPEDTAIATGVFGQSTVVPIDNEPTPRLIVESPLPGCGYRKVDLSVNSSRVQKSGSAWAPS